MGSSGWTITQPMRGGCCSDLNVAPDKEKSSRGTSTIPTDAGLNQVRGGSLSRVRVQGGRLRQRATCSGLEVTDAMAICNNSENFAATDRVKQNRIRERSCGMRVSV